MNFGEAPNELLKRIDFEKNLVKDYVIDINQQLDVILESHNKINFQSEKDVSEIKVKLVVPGKTFIIKKLNRALIHHVGRRWWRDKLKSDEDYDTILRLSLQVINSSIKDYENIIGAVLCTNQMVIRYFEEAGNSCVYGVVSQSFIPSNQLEFRRLFIDIASQNGLINPKILYKDNYYSDSFGEFFPGNASVNEIGFNYGLYYGLNNGYAAYNVVAHRYTKLDKCWLTPLKVKTSFKYKNDSHTTVEDFVKGVAIFMEAQFPILESNVVNLKNTEYKRSVFEELYTKLEVKLQKSDLQIFNNSFRKRWNLGKNNTGRTNWTVITSLLASGTYERFSNDQIRWMFMELGTDIIGSNGLDEFLASNSSIGSDKKYKNLPIKVITG